MNTALKIGILGLGYVGFPLLVGLREHSAVVGFDKAESRVNSLLAGHDDTGEVDFLASGICPQNLDLTSDPRDERLKACNIYIVAVPTPVDIRCKPDISMLKDASHMLGSLVDRGDVVIYESTVYPGTTTKICIPIIEKISGMKDGKDFFVGYSPERVNPGDSAHSISNVVKVIGSPHEKAKKVMYEVYSPAVRAGLYTTDSIEVAEAAKIVENVQRDVNIALMNELSVLFEALDIDTKEVIETAATKWNFAYYTPGLVGGHCIGVDPYYLTYCAREVNLSLNLMTQARKTNEDVPSRVGRKIVEHLKKNSDLKKVVLWGVTFKENCADTRNSGSLKIALFLIDAGIHVMWNDPYVSVPDFGFEIAEFRDGDSYHDGLHILAVPHKQIVENLQDRLIDNKITSNQLFDLRSVFATNQSVFRL